jgi:alpha-ketoglutarate-dependent taurine dioxygenase
VAVEALGPGISAWVGGDAVPPLFIAPVSSGVIVDHAALRAWARDHREGIDRLILEHGGIVLRDFPITSAEEFDNFISVFPAYQPGYVGGMSPRKKIRGQVLESTRLAQDFKIMLHSEMAYMKSYPPRIAFFCKQASPVGGETIIGSMREFMKKLPDGLRHKLEAHGVRVVRNFAAAGSSKDKTVIDHPDKVGWDDAFYTNSRDEVETHCRDLGMEAIWNVDGSLTLVDMSKAFTVHPKTGEQFYRANLHTNEVYDLPGYREIAAVISAKQEQPSGHFLDNGEKLTADEAKTIRSIFDEIEIAWPWQNGDVMILDNLQVAHGRNPFTGPREIMVALLEV